ncbi:MAG: ATP-binding protein, partial [Candidatus Thorarchaeota archaeon]
TWLIVDEAHTLVPKSGSTPAKDAIVGYAKLGRRFGCSLVLCTQQPSAVADEAISQADIIVTHSLSHDSDIRALQQRAPAVMPETFRDKVFISSLPRGVALVFDQTTENKRGFMIQVRPRISQHGGTDRLSALFEAVRLTVPEDPHLEEAAPSGVEVDAEPEAFEEFIEEMPEVPRPPLKLSKEDWELLDTWMREYIQTLSERQIQEFDLTEEASPREEEPVTTTLEWELPEVEPFEEYAPALIDGSEVSIRRFGPISESLLSKAITRKVLYSPVTHEFLFGTKTLHRETSAILKRDIEPHLLFEAVVKALSESGMTIDSIDHGDGFSFVLLQKADIRAALSGGASGSLTCVSAVLVGSNRKEVAVISSQLANLAD